MNYTNDNIDVKVGHELSKVEKELSRGVNISIIGLIDSLIERAYTSGASDIHIDPSDKEVRVRLRIDGVLQDVYTFPKNIHSEIISRIKVLAQLRTDEHQSTQDGRFRHHFQNGDFIDIRVSIAPTYHGENSVMRLLSNSANAFTLESMGFSESDIKKIEYALKKPSGMILSTGPTGSGKTTTLYTLIRMLNTKEVSIVTIEDPIEYSIGNIKQIQVNPRTGLSFSNGLRSILRQDPDIIMVGEIRDSDTANIAVNTALTGHLLLSTLHTNDAATTLPRLLDMGVEEYLAASTINIAIGQRLVRKICTYCKEEMEMTPDLIQSLTNTGLGRLIRDGDVFYKGAGCRMCGGSGYAGRISINEVMVVDDRIREAIIRKASSSELNRIAVEQGMTTMLEDGYMKVKSGFTTLEEILRVMRE